MLFLMTTLLLAVYNNNLHNLCRFYWVFLTCASLNAYVSCHKNFDHWCPWHWWLSVAVCILVQSCGSHLPAISINVCRQLVGLSTRQSWVLVLFCVMVTIIIGILIGLEVTSVFKNGTISPWAIIMIVLIMIIMIILLLLLLLCKCFTVIRTGCSHWQQATSRSLGSLLFLCLILVWLISRV